MRAAEAQRAKAGRGELVAGVPVGYRLGEDGRVEKTPDARVRQVIDSIFAKFFELGSGRQVMLWMLGSKLQVPINSDRKGHVVWRDVTSDYVYRILKNPMYAGAYVYGRTKQRTCVVDGQMRTSVERRPRGEWSVLLRDRHEAYITWEQFVQAGDMLSKNVQSRGVPGAARGGTALLGGLVWCRRCGRRLNVSYSGSGHRIGRYVCDDAHHRCGELRCLSFSAVDVDAQVALQVLAVVKPGAIEAARAAWREESAAGDAAVAALELQLQQARYQVDRAERQYNAVEPENRTVAIELERRWNTSLDAVSALEQRLAEATAARERQASPPDAGRYVELARDIERVWESGTTQLSLKKRVVRAVVEQVWSNVDETRREILLVIHWKGGAHTELRVAKRRTGQHRRTTSIEVVDAVRILTRVMGDEQIARWLGRAGLRTPSGSHYTRALVASVRHLRGIEVCREQPSGARRLCGWSVQPIFGGLLLRRPPPAARAPPEVGEAGKIEGLIAQSAKLAGDGVSISGEVNDNLREITGSVAKVTDIVAEIAAASEEQTRGIDEINQTVAEMDKVVQAAAANSEESSSAAEDLVAKARELVVILDRFALRRARTATAEPPGPSQALTRAAGQGVAPRLLAFDDGEVLPKM